MGRRRRQHKAAVYKCIGDKDWVPLHAGPRVERNISVVRDGRFLIPASPRTAGRTGKRRRRRRQHALGCRYKCIWDKDWVLPLPLVSPTETSVLPSESTHRPDGVGRTGKWGEDSAHKAAAAQMHGDKDWVPLTSGRTNTRVNE
jgi:hypothetical protein